MAYLLLLLIFPLFDSLEIPSNQNTREVLRLTDLTSENKFTKWDLEKLEDIEFLKGLDSVKNIENSSFEKDLPKSIIEKALFYTRQFEVNQKNIYIETCHGVFISPTHLLTAAHCVKNITTNLSNITIIDYQERKTIQVVEENHPSNKKIYKNPFYYKNFYLHSADIAVIEIDTPTKNHFSFSKNKIHLDNKDNQCFITDFRNKSPQKIIKITELASLRLKDQPDFSQTFYKYESSNYKIGRLGYSGGPIWCYDPKTDDLFLNGITSAVSLPKSPMEILLITANLGDYNYSFIEAVLKNTEIENEEILTKPIYELYNSIVINR